VVETVRVNLLGTFRVSVGGRVVEESAWRLRKAASLVKVLALAPGHWPYTILPEPVKAEYTDIDTTEGAESTTSFDGRMKHPDDPTDLANYFRLDGGILFSTHGLSYSIMYDASSKEYVPILTS
jgi:hypothetical protein